MLTKIDNALLKICEFLVLRKVKKSKYKQHKYHVEEGWNQMELILCLCAMVLDLIGSLSHGHRLIGITNFVIFIPVVLIKIMSIRNLRELVEAYDWIWLNRKNPVIYNSIKELGEECWVREQRRRQRMIKVYFGLLFLISMVLSVSQQWTTVWMIVCYPIHILGMYNRYVFDLEPPEEKRKEESDSKLTNLMQKQLEKLFGNFAPKPI